MSKHSKMVRNEQRRLVVARHAERRAQLKALIAALGEFNFTQVRSWIDRREVELTMEH